MQRRVRGACGEPPLRSAPRALKPHRLSSSCPFRHSQPNRHRKVVGLACSSPCGEVLDFKTFTSLLLARVEEVVEILLRVE